MFVYFRARRWLFWPFDDVCRQSPLRSPHCLAALGRGCRRNTTGMDDLQIRRLTRISPPQPPVLQDRFQVTRFGVIDPTPQGCDSIGHTRHGFLPYLTPRNTFASLSWHSLQCQSMLICTILPVSRLGGEIPLGLSGLVRMIRKSRGWCMISMIRDALIRPWLTKETNGTAVIPLRMS